MLQYTKKSKKVYKMIKKKSLPGASSSALGDGPLGSFIAPTLGTM